MKTAAEVWAQLSPMQKAKLIAWDIWLKVQLFGGPPETMTEHFAKSKLRGEAAGIKACAILDRIDPGHCDRALRHPTYAALTAAHYHQEETIAALSQEVAELKGQLGTPTPEE